MGHADAFINVVPARRTAGCDLQSETTDGIVKPAANSN